MKKYLFTLSFCNFKIKHARLCHSGGRAMLCFISFLLLISNLFTLNAQSWLWARQGRNSLPENGGPSIAIDNLHNVYQTGEFQGNTFILGSDTLFANGEPSFLVKYDENGNLLWAKSSQPAISANAQSQANWVTIDKNNNAYITGGFSDTVYFQAIALESLDGVSGQQMFLVKYDANGNVKWAKQSKSINRTNNSNDTYGFSAATDKSGNVYVTGQFQDTVSFDSDTLKGNINDNFFIIKYDSLGNVKWAKQSAYNIRGYSQGYAVTTDKWGYIYVTGYFIDTVTFDSQMLHCLHEDVFIVKYDSNGNVVWAKQPTNPSGSCAAVGEGICTDVDGNVYINGAFYDTLSFGATTLISPYPFVMDIFWAKYSSSGNILWAKQAYNMDAQLWYGWSIVTDNSKNFYLTGGRPTFGPLKAKIVFNNDTLQLSEAKHATVWLKFDSLGTILNSYIFPTGGACPQVPTVTDTSGCYVYFGGDTWDTTMSFGKDTVGTNNVHPHVFWPFVARWSDGKCSESDGINALNPKNLVTNLYPNPNNGRFTIVIATEALSAEQTGKQTPPMVEIYNVFGERIYFETLKQSRYLSGQGDNLINLNNQPSGVYLYRVIDQQSNSISSGKFIIQ